MEEALRLADVAHQETDALAVRAQIGLEVGRAGDGEVEDVVEVAGQRREVARLEIRDDTLDAGLLELGLLLGVAEAGARPDFVVLGEGERDGAGDLAGGAGDEDFLALHVDFLLLGLGSGLEVRTDV